MLRIVDFEKSGGPEFIVDPVCFSGGDPMERNSLQVDILNLLDVSRGWPTHCRTMNGVAVSLATAQTSTCI